MPGLTFVILCQLARAAVARTFDFVVDMTGTGYPNVDYDNVIINGGWSIPGVHTPWQGWGVQLALNPQTGTYNGGLTLGDDAPDFEYLVALSGPKDEYSGWGLNSGEGGCGNFNSSVTVTPDVSGCFVAPPSAPPVTLAPPAESPASPAPPPSDAPVAQSPSPPTGACATFFPPDFDVDLLATDLASVSLPIDNCCQQCAQRPVCIGFVVYEGFCYLKSGANPQTIPNTGRISYRRIIVDPPPSAPRGPMLPLGDMSPEALVSSMTLTEKIAQMLMIEMFRGSTVDQEQGDVSAAASVIRTYGIGAVLGGGDSFWPMGTRDVAKLVTELQAAAVASPRRIPALFGIDAVHGNALVRGATIFPHQIGLGSARNESLMRSVARVTRRELRACGMHLNFAPAVSIPRDARWGRTYEGYSDDVDVVSDLARAYIEELQDGDDGVLACAKHFAGDGETTFGTGHLGRVLDRGDVREASEKDIATFLKPYEIAIDAGIRVIMTSYSSINGEPSHVSKKYVTEWLKEGKNFTGFVLSDWDALNNACPECWNTAENVLRTPIENEFTCNVGNIYAACSSERRYAAAINAGVDMIMMPFNFEEHMKAIANAVVSGKVSMERIDDAVTRILRVKQEQGLFDEARAHRLYPEPAQPVRDAYAQRVAREASEQSTAILLNEDDVLPLRPGSDVLVACHGAKDKYRPLGGWSLAWQGAPTDFWVDEHSSFDYPRVHTDSIWEALTDDLLCRGCVFHSLNGSTHAQTDVALAVVSEPPYAEFYGDRPYSTPHAVGLSREDEICIDTLYASNPDRPIVVLALTGRPLDLSRYYDAQSTSKGDELRGKRGVRAIVSAWLPGESGMGVANVLWGRAAATGTLPRRWLELPTGWGVALDARSDATCGCRRFPGGVSMYVVLLMAAPRAVLIVACILRCGCLCTRCFRRNCMSCALEVQKEDP